MGLITRILSAVRGTQNGAKVTNVKHNPGAGANRTSELFQPPGVDSMPIPGDYAATVPVQRSGGEAVVGTLDPNSAQTAQAGEARLYARSADGTEVASIHAKNDGTITAGNDESSVEQAADGTITAVNTGGAGFVANSDGSTIVVTAHGDNVFGSDGSVLFSNGAVLTPTGDLITALGVSLDLHDHVGNLGVPTSVPRK